MSVETDYWEMASGDVRLTLQLDNYADRSASLVARLQIADEARQRRRGVYRPVQSSGAQQDFRMTSLGWTQTKGVYHIWSGQDIVALEQKLTEANTEINDLRQRLAAAQPGQPTDDGAAKALTAVKALADALKGL